MISRKNYNSGFTLVETLAAITLITIAIVAPMALTVQSLESAYYARDQITASNLAQEGLEAIRSVRDGNILSIAEGNAVTTLFQNIMPACSVSCYVDATAFKTPPTDLSPVITACSGTCPVLRTNTTNPSVQLYGYVGTWTPTIFTRSITATVVRNDGGGNAQELRITVTVGWKTAAYKSEQIQLSENLYDWVATGAAT